LDESIGNPECAPKKRHCRGGIFSVALAVYGP
jgi:hypothetical protein